MPPAPYSPQVKALLVAVILLIVLVMLLALLILSKVV